MAVGVQLQSPVSEGKYKLFWVLLSTEGEKIGKRVSCSIVVGGSGEVRELESNMFLNHAYRRDQREPVWTKRKESGRNKRERRSA